MRFPNSSIKITHIMRGVTSQKAKSRSGQTAPMNPVEKNCFTDVKTLRQSSYDFHQIIVQRLQMWAQG
jgi:hypothetical protein